MKCDESGVISAWDKRSICFLSLCFDERPIAGGYNAFRERGFFFVLSDCVGHTSPFLRVCVLPALFFSGHPHPVSRTPRTPHSRVAGPSRRCPPPALFFGAL